VPDDNIPKYGVPDWEVFPSGGIIASDVTGDKRDLLGLNHY